VDCYPTLKAGRAAPRLHGLENVLPFETKDRVVDIDEHESRVLAEAVQLLLAPDFTVLLVSFREIGFPTVFHASNSSVAVCCRRRLNAGSGGAGIKQKLVLTAIA